MAPHTTYSVRKPILRFFQRGKTQRETADLTDTSKSSVNRTIVNFKETDSIGPKPRTGRRPKAYERSIQNLLKMATVRPRVSARQLKNDLTDGHLYTVDGVRKVLNKYGLNRRVAPKKFKVTARHRLLGKKWCMQMVKNLPTDFSKRVATDESAFQLDHRQKEFVLRPKGLADFSHCPQYLARSTNTRSTKLTVWGCSLVFQVLNSCYILQFFRWTSVPNSPHSPDVNVVGNL